MEQLDNLQVDLVEHSPEIPYSGIRRYARELCKHLSPHVSVRMTTQVDPPFTHALSFLHHLPIGVRAHRDGSIVHFTEDLGCSQMLWHPMRPAIATSHDLGFLAWQPEASMHRAFDRIVVYLSYLGLKRMDTVITVSEFSRQMVIKRLGIPSERVVTIHSGNDGNRFKPIADAHQRLARHYGLSDNDGYKNLLYVGTEPPRKNMTTLLKALSLLPPYVRLIKIGNAGSNKFRQQTKKLIAEFDLEDRVCFFDQVPEHDLPLFYNIADVYVCASFLEGFGHPVVEAMACGTPVVCSNVASLPEITNGAAILVSPNDAHAFADSILELLSNRRLCEQMVLRGLDRAAMFSWDRTAAQVIEVYRRVVRRNGVAA